MLSLGNCLAQRTGGPESATLSAWTRGDGRTGFLRQGWWVGLFARATASHMNDEGRCGGPDKGCGLRRQSDLEHANLTRPRRFPPREGHRRAAQPSLDCLACAIRASPASSLSDRKTTQNALPLLGAAGEAFDAIPWIPCGTVERFLFGHCWLTACQRQGSLL